MSIFYIPVVLAHTQLVPEWHRDYAHPQLLAAQNLEAVDTDEITNLFIMEKKKNLEFSQEIISVFKTFYESWSETIKSKLINTYPTDPIFIEMKLPHTYNLDLQSGTIREYGKDPQVILSSSLH